VEIEEQHKRNKNNRLELLKHDSKWKWRWNEEGTYLDEDTKEMDTPLGW